jgi:hypothetical protein
MEGVVMTLPEAQPGSVVHGKIVHVSEAAGFAFIADASGAAKDVFCGKWALQSLGVPPRVGMMVRAVIGLARNGRPQAERLELLINEKE